MKTLKRRYTVIFEPQPEGGYTVTVPALPGCVSQAETLREARKMAAEAVQAYCESLVKDGLRLPKDIRGVPVHEKLDITLATA
jgi:predicted RNase H-like HicB family nuclease